MASLRMCLMSLLALTVGSSHAAPCKTEMDCSLGGTCEDGICKCYPTWTGRNCSLLNVLPAPDPFAFYRPGNQSSWGGSVVQDGDSYHMFAADMTDHCGLNAWQRNSAIRHLVSESPSGPFQPSDVIMPPFSHNPTVQRAADGTYLIFHIGDGRATYHGPPLNNCSGGTTPEQNGEPFEKAGAAPALAIGSQVSPSIIYSVSPEGPWQSLSSSGGSSCNNPAAFTGFENGTVLLICKVKDESNIRRMQVSVAPHWRGPYTVVSTPPVWGEDAYIWRAPESEGGHFHMLLHSMHPHKYPTTAWSLDGIEWTAAFAANLNATEADAYASFPLRIDMKNGSSLPLHRRERHQLLLNADGQPAWIFNGVGLTTANADFTFTAVQPIATTV